MNTQTGAVTFIIVVTALLHTHAGALAQVPNPFDPFSTGALSPQKTKPARETQPPEQANNENRPFLRQMPGANSGGTSGDPSSDPSGEWAPANPRPDGTSPSYRDNANNAPPPRYNGASPGSVSQTGIKREELSPVISSNGSGLPYELWRGLDIESVEKLIAALTIPPRSQALHALWARLISAPSTVLNDPQTDSRFNAIRLQALYRSGITEKSGNQYAASPASNPAINILTVRSAIVSGVPGNACEDVRRIDLNAVPESLKPETIVLFGYCALSSGNRAATEMAASLARDYDLRDDAALAALDAAAQGTQPTAPNGKTLSGLAYRLLEKAGWKPIPDIARSAEPALLEALSNDSSIAPQTRASIGESAARIHAITPTKLADIYRQVGRPDAAAATGASSWSAAPANAATPSEAIARANLFVALENEYTPFKKARLTRSFLDSARRAGIYLQALEMAHTATGTLLPVPEISWFAETGIEIALAARDFRRAHAWTTMTARLDPRSTGRLDHWLALVDIANPDQVTPRGASLKSVENLALSGRFGSEQLHRLATVLDALDYNVPIPLWQAASNTPQPNTGHLPETGVLTRLQDAAKSREFGRTVLLAMQALGPDGAEGAHMIALGDTIRALKRANLESDARRLGFEALFAVWPRVTSQ